MPSVNIANDDFELHSPVIEEKKWPWTDKWLDFQREKLGLTEEQCKEIEKKANDKFAEMARENMADYSEETKRRIHEDIEHIYLHNIVESVIKYTPQDIVNAHESGNIEAIADIAKNNAMQFDRSEQEMKQDAALKKESVPVIAASTAVVTESLSEEESEEVKKKRKMMQDKPVEQNVVSESSTSSSNKVENSVDEKKVVPVVMTKDEKIDDSKIAPAAASVSSVESLKDAKPADKFADGESLKLAKSEKSKFLSNFRNLGLPLGIPFVGRRSKLADVFDNSEFSVKRHGVQIKRDAKDSNLVNVSFDGRCEEGALVGVGNGCFVKVGYNKTNGDVEIARSKVLYIAPNGEEKEIDLHSKGGLRGRLFGHNGDLEKIIGHKNASEVRKGFNDLKLIAFSNPKLEESGGHSVEGCAAMINGKTHGVRPGKNTKIAAAVTLALAGVAGVLTGIGVIPGFGALAGAAALVTSSISNNVVDPVGNAFTKARAVDLVGHSKDVIGHSKDVVGHAKSFSIESANAVNNTAQDKYPSAKEFLTSKAGIAAEAGTAGLLLGGAAVAATRSPKASAQSSSVASLGAKNAVLEK